MKKSVGAKTILLPTPVLAVGTYDPEGRPNVMTAAWGGICCSKPPCVAVSLRAATYSHGNLLRRRAFTVGIPSQEHLREADYFGRASGRDEDKWTGSGLHPERAEYVDAPFVAEFPVVLECRLLHTLELGLHTQFVGEIVDVKVEEACLADGKVDPSLVRPCIYSHDTSSYYLIGEFAGRARTLGKDLSGPVV